MDARRVARTGVCARIMPVQLLAVGSHGGTAHGNAVSCASLPAGEPLRGSWGDGARPAARRRTLGCHDLCEFASGARPARLRRKRREASEQVHGRSFGRGRREGTGAKVVQSAEVCNNCARSFANLILHVDGCQTKLSHFDAVACNTEQCPDRFHARRRAPLLPFCTPEIWNAGVWPVTLADQPTVS